MTARRLGLIVIVVAAIAARCSCEDPDDVAIRFGTFNIENFPKHDRQVAGAFAEIAALGASFIAVQEIGDPARFHREARVRLGDTWDFAHADTAPLGLAQPSHHLGVLFDRRRWTFVSLRSHDETRLERGRHKPIVEVRLRPVAGGPSRSEGDRIVRVLVAHLKAGSDGRDIRAKQYIALGAIVRAVQRSGERIVLLGDFNATNDLGDRRDLAHLAATTGLTWATEPLACSAFWSRDDGCPRSRLDHVLTWTPPRTVKAAGACATAGCDWQDRCPLYAEQVSDHCPVVVTF